MAESHHHHHHHHHQVPLQQHPPPSLPMFSQQQQGASSWYPNVSGGNNNLQFQFQNHHQPPFQHYLPPPHHLPPPSHLHQPQHIVPRPLADRHPLPYPPSQPYHQPDYYPQQTTSHPMASQPLQSQFTFMYSQQDQVRPTNVGWGYRQWEYPEEDWAVRARAWAAAKAAMDSDVHVSTSMHQSLHDYQQKELQPWMDMPQSSLNPPGEDAFTVNNDTTSNMGLKDPTNHVGKPAPAAGLEHSSENSEQRFTSGHFHGPSYSSQIVSSNFFLDGTSTIGRETSSPGIEKKESAPEQAFQQPPISTFSQQQPRFLPPSQVHQEHFSYHEPLPSAKIDYHLQQHLGMQEELPQSFHQHQQFGTSVLPSVLEHPEGDPSLMTSNTVQNWPTTGSAHLRHPSVTAPVITGSPQFEHLLPLHPPHHLAASQSPVFGKSHGPQPTIGFPPDGASLTGLFGIGANSPLASGPGGPMFFPDGNSGLGFPERPKKAAVPSWLKEELLKKKAAALTGIPTGALASEDSNKKDRDGDQMDSLSYETKPSSPVLSDNDTDEREDEIEAASNAAINQEIKRILTEVLLKVTGDLFDEIAQEVLEENGELTYSDAGDDQNGSAKSRFSTPSITPVPPNTTDLPIVAAAARVVIASLMDGVTYSRTENASVNLDNVAGNVLGLANYASDEEEVEMSKVTERGKVNNKDVVDLRSAYPSEDIWQRNVGGRDVVEVNAKQDEQKKRTVEFDSTGEYMENVENKGKDNIGGDEGNTVIQTDRGRGGDFRKIQSNEKKRSPESFQSHQQEFHEYKNSERTREREWDSGSTGESHRQEVGKDAKSKHLLQPDTRQVERVDSKSRNVVSQMGDTNKECRKTENENISSEVVEGKGKEAAANRSSKVISDTSDKREKESKGIANSAKNHHELSGKDKRKREGKSSDINARKSVDARMVDQNTSDEHDKDRSRRKQKEKVKEKVRERESQHARDYKRDGKQTNEKRSREKRSSANTRRSRRCSSSSSSRERSVSRNGSSSSSESQRRQNARRSSVRVTRSRSPVKSRKRRESHFRSGSRSRSPRVKQFRRNSSSLSRDKARYKRSRSRSPVHRRRRS